MGAGGAAGAINLVSSRIFPCTSPARTAPHHLMAAVPLLVSLWLGTVLVRSKGLHGTAREARALCRPFISCHGREEPSCNKNLGSDPTNTYA